MEKEELKRLFIKYHEGTCTEEEKAILEAWYLEYNEQDLVILPKSIKAIGNRVFKELPGNHTVFIKIGFRLAAAAILVGVVLTVTLKFWLQPVESDKAVVVKDIAPGTNKAILTLSSGKKINLSNALTGQLATQTGIQILKTANGQITYKQIGSSVNPGELRTNNITVPRGGQWQLTLPDGSKIWLNSATSFSYPATFANQKERIVQLNGEAYFEVAKDKLHPFIVQTDKQTIEVLGTHFNINSYPDEPSVKTTLAEGRIRISTTTGNPTILITGEQAVLTNGHFTVGIANIDEALAWKNSYFRFNDENIQSTMRKLSRWYNIDVLYGPGISADGMNGKISRYKNISQVLKALEATKTVHFKVEGRRVTVLK